MNEQDKSGKLPLPLEGDFAPVLPRDEREEKSTPPAQPRVREAHDSSNHDALSHDPSDEEGKAEIALDESFPASDPPAHSSAGSAEPAPSSGYDEGAERELAERRDRVRARANELWEIEGRPDGRELDHWAQAESETA